MSRRSARTWPVKVTTTAIWATADPTTAVRIATPVPTIHRVSFVTRPVYHVRAGGGPPSVLDGRGSSRRCRRRVGSARHCCVRRSESADDGGGGLASPADFAEEDDR